MSSSKAKTPTGRLSYLDPKKIEKNPQNPRLLFDLESMEVLKKSVAEVGILVPLLVYERSSDHKHVILDGERRWQCALQLNMTRVPANIIPEPTTIQNILTMFNIHNVREEWEITPMALKLEVVMRILKTEDEEEIAKLTGMSQWNVKRCKSLLSFPRKYLDMTLTTNKDERLKGDFFVELYPALEVIKQAMPEVSKRHSRNEITNGMLVKYRAGVIKAVTEFRDLTKLVRSVEKGAPKDRVENLVESIITQPDVGIRQTFKDSAKVVYDVEKIEKTCRILRRSLSKLDLAEVEHPSILVKTLAGLRSAIDDVLGRLKES